MAYIDAHVKNVDSVRGRRPSFSTSVNSTLVVKGIALADHREYQDFGRDAACLLHAKTLLRALVLHAALLKRVTDACRSPCAAHNHLGINFIKPRDHAYQAAKL